MKAGDYVICKFDGRNNGDLIVGRVKGVLLYDIICTDLLTGEESDKKKTVILKRNIVCSQEEAEQVVARYKAGGVATRRDDARVLAKIIANKIVAMQKAALL